MLSTSSYLSDPLFIPSSNPAHYCDSGFFLIGGAQDRLQLRSISTLHVVSNGPTICDRNFDILRLREDLYAVSNYDSPFGIEVFSLQSSSEASEILSRPLVVPLCFQRAHSDTVVRMRHISYPFFASCSFDGTIRIFSAESQSCAAVLSPESSPMQLLSKCLSFSNALREDPGVVGPPLSVNYCSLCYLDSTFSSSLLFGGHWVSDGSDIRMLLPGSIDIFDVSRAAYLRSVLLPASTSSHLSKSPTFRSTRDMKTDARCRVVACGGDGMVRWLDSRCDGPETICSTSDLQTDLCVLWCLKDRSLVAVLSGRGTLHVIDDRKPSIALPPSGIRIHPDAQNNVVGLSRVGQSDWFLSSSYSGQSIASWRITDGKIAALVLDFDYLSQDEHPPGRAGPGNHMVIFFDSESEV